MGLATLNTLYPVYVYEEGMELPKEGTYYVVAGNGKFLHKDTGLVRCFIPVENISVLEDLNMEAEVECKLPKVPARHVWRIKEFFRRVVEKYRAEAEVNLYFNKNTGDYKIHVPEQTVTHGGVRYKRVALTHVEGMEDYLRVGTIHSHCDFGAFHSGTDVGDEEDFDGLHVTFGHNDKDRFTISASVVVNGHRMKVDPESVLEGITHPQGICGGDNQYGLIDSDADRDHHQWADGLDEWMAQVSGSLVWGYFPTTSHNGLGTGDKVAWAGDNTATQLKSVVGEGPFEVLAAESGKLVIKTNVGLARFSSKLFKKVVS